MIDEEDIDVSDIAETAPFQSLSGAKVPQISAAAVALALTAAIT